MRTLIVSDIHSNIVALDAVLEAAEEDEPIDGVISLGDIVGYGPAPMECLDRLRERGFVSIKGNHDAAVAGEVSLDTFNPVAAEASRWTTAQLNADSLAFLAALPERLIEDSFTMVHGTPNDPIWDYLVSYSQAVEAWERVETSDVLVGHSHIQFAIEAGRGIEQSGPEGVLTVPLGHARLVVNPGSVGQPRDRDPRAAYAIYDDESRLISLRRAWYDVSATQRAMAEAGLPEPLITRLSAGR
jgi:predicted phosphodiesterase